MNILLINLDSTLAVKQDTVVGNAKARHIEYAKRLESLHIIVKTFKNIKSHVIKIKDNLLVYPTSSLNKYLFLYDAYNIGSRICKENKIDLIVTQDPFITGLIGWLLKKKHNIPLNIQVHGDMVGNKYFIKEGTFNFLLNGLSRLLMQKADTVRVTTSRQKENLILQGIDREKIYCVPAFVNFSVFEQQNDNNVTQFYLNGRFDKIVLSASRLAKEKNIETLIRAMPYVIKKYHRCLFLIVGSGSEDKCLKRLASNLGVEEFIRFIGPINYKDMPCYFQAADIFVSTAHYEGTCMTIQEAAAAKKPIISTPHAGAYDALKNGYTGFIVGFDDYFGFSEKIVYLLENDDIAKDMGIQAHAFVTKYFNKEDILNKYYNLWEETKCRREFY